MTDANAPYRHHLSFRKRRASPCLSAAFLGLLFDGFELGLMPVASRSVTQSLLGTNYTEVDNVRWFARFTAALMLGAAVGGSLLGNLGDRIGRARAMGVSVLIYSIFAGLGAFVTSCNEMLALRFLVGLGVGGMWPNGVALVAESWPDAARPTVAGILGAGINVGILGLSQLGRYLAHHARFLAVALCDGRDSSRPRRADSDAASRIAKMARRSRPRSAARASAQRIISRRVAAG